MSNGMDSAPATGSWLQLLVSRGSLGAGDAAQLETVHRESHQSLASIALRLGKVSERALAEAMAEHAGLEAISSVDFPPPGSEPAQVLPNFWRTHELLPLGVTDDTLLVATWDVSNRKPIEALEFSTRLRVREKVATRGAIVTALETRFDAGKPPDAANATEFAGAADADELDRLKDLASDAPIIRLVQRLINLAVDQRASDIHLEPSERGLVVRFRADGVLREIETQSRAVAAPTVSRIKVMAGLNIAERRLPQDGRTRISVHGKDIDFRVATSPTIHGESVVLRILDRQDVQLDFDALGFDAGLIATLRDAIARPFGIVLVTGPTGSGKTTTLYAALKELNVTERKILTVEDPVEYMLPGVNQVPVKPQIGLTFAHMLRAFLRQDPDVLMVGEIRDRETAEVAIQAALTGHLLLSTLHTNTAAAAITRLLDMGIDDYLITSTLHVVIGQRLVRRLCAACRAPYEPSAEVRARFAVREPVTWFRAVGCSACEGTGYRKRTTILEALRMSEAVRAKILARADAHAIETVAVAEGMRTMLGHGLARVGAGETTLEEILRVTSLG
ncbi:MAG TPA: GspE/PulE family protein [Steroidobacteraceae bacterium]|nr:GspE/PulE family protein [Steroidobacteraceae bacterium]